MFNQKDLQQLADLGIEESLALRQISNFQHGFPFSLLLKPAILGDGLIALTRKEVESLAANYDSETGKLDILKFVPASGAATRMFKDIYSFWNDLLEGNSPDVLFSKYPDAKIFFEKLHHFPFIEDIESFSGRKVESMIQTGDYELILRHFLSEKGLNYGNLPKGLLKFHRYPGRTRTPIEEHWIEGAAYAKSPDGLVKVHFTISPNHESSFKQLLSALKPAYENEFDIKLDISYSFQKPSTDVIAVDIHNQPFREADGRLVFRPGGHGALLENLNECSADLIFIKNIDNVVPDRLKAETVLYKKALAGLILSYRDRIFKYIRKLESNADQLLIEEVNQFIKKELNYYNQNEKNCNAGELISILNRPIRACGMVKNEGEPGGGPFWVKDNSGNISLQVVESSQVDLENPAQKEIFAKATHFNPVDLVCLVKDYKGDKFNLPDFRDPGTGFITIKSKDGKSIKAQELPGLWNGSMAYWNTFFVEVPLITFNPVKTVNDLLRSNHI